MWVEIKWPAATSDYMAWVTSCLHKLLVENSVSKKIIDGFTFVGDNAYVKKHFMATPLKGVRGGYEDVYNFYLSQLRITIERAFGVLVHRWAILRAPLTVPLHKIAPLVESLIRLHNFCIDEDDTCLAPIKSQSLISLGQTVRCSRLVGGEDAERVEIGDDGRPASLLGHGHHFVDAEQYRHERLLGDTPMDLMIESVRKQKLRRPKY